MYDGAPQKHCRLPSEFVALIHHVELSEAGWRDQLLDQIIVSSMFLRTTPCGAEELRTSLDYDFSLTVDDRAFPKSVNRLMESKRLIEIYSGRLKLTEQAASAAQATIVENKSLEDRVAKRFKEIVAEEVKAPDPDDCWRRFCDDCLDPLVTKLGARTYELNGYNRAKTACPELDYSTGKGFLILSPSTPFRKCSSADSSDPAPHAPVDAR